MDTDEFILALRQLCEDCPDGHIRLVRMAHADDPHRRPPYHGPNWSRLPSPYQDVPRHSIADHEHCAALPHQFRDWWPKPGFRVSTGWDEGDGSEEYAVEYSESHRVFVLQVPAYDAVVQQRQVVYNPRHATVVAQFQPH